jgi:hypothetical protein
MFSRETTHVRFEKGGMGECGDENSKGGEGESLQ